MTTVEGRFRARAPIIDYMKNKAKTIERLRRVRDRATELHATGATEAFEKWRSDAAVAVRMAFGEESEEYEGFRSISYAPRIYVTGDRDAFTDSRRAGLALARDRLDSMVDQVIEYWPDDEELPSATDRSTPVNRSGSRRVFVIHGRNDAAKQEVARVLEQLNLEPIILHEQSSGGRTIIEKLEEYSDVGFAVVLLTKDDVGRGVDDHKANLDPRARQNVVFEFGYFIGRLGRKKVCPLLEEGIEQPSDAHGVVYIPFDSAGGWKVGLCRELVVAGFEVDANRLF